MTTPKCGGPRTWETTPAYRPTSTTPTPLEPRITGNHRGTRGDPEIRSPGPGIRRPGQRGDRGVAHRSHRDGAHMASASPGPRRADSVVHVSLIGHSAALTAKELAELRSILGGARQPGTGGYLVLHHGCRPGSDEVAHRIVRRWPAWRIEGHPGTDGSPEPTRQAHLRRGRRPQEQSPSPARRRNHAHRARPDRDFPTCRRPSPNPPANAAGTTARPGNDRLAAAGPARRQRRPDRHLASARAHRQPGGPPPTGYVRPRHTCRAAQPWKATMTLARTSHGRSPRPRREVPGSLRRLASHRFF
jgi:hypothetical protein